MTKIVSAKSTGTFLIFFLTLVGMLVAASTTLAQQAAEISPAKVVAASDSIDPYFRKVYRDFYDSYKLGPDDELAIRILNQPDYTLEKVKISPVGRIYHPLLGDIEVAGLTVDKLTEKLTADFSQYIINPKLSVSLLEANSAKVGVLGDVAHPGIVVMTRPMTVLDVLSATGGISDLGSKSKVTILRQSGYDRPQTVNVNVKRILEGKANSEENLRLQAGDTIIVHGNKRKKFTQFTSLLGFGGFMSFLLGR
jgi:polysaccharide export outer membrane protein